MEVRSKVEFYRLNALHRFGNRLKTWDTVGSYLASGHPEKVALRALTPSGRFQPYLTKDQIQTRFRPGEFLICEHAKDEVLTIQGEVHRSINYVDLFYSQVPNLPMRIGLARHGKHVDGLRALMMLKHYCDPPSYDDLWELLDDFDGAVVEFSAYPMAVGIYNRNTLIWEVRTSY